MNYAAAQPCEGERQDVQQIAFRLPYLNEEVAAIQMRDGRLYIPAVALCAVLGLAAPATIRRWSRMLLWEESRKLPYRSPRGSCRTVRCLPLPMVPFACANCPRNGLTEERRQQIDRWLGDASRVLFQFHLCLLTSYQTTKRLLYRFLGTATGATDTIRMRARQMEHRLDTEFWPAFRTRIEEGCLLIDEAASRARAILQEQANAPVVDALLMNEDGSIRDERSFPLLPVIDEEQLEQFFASVDALNHWYEGLSQFLNERGL